MYQFLVDNPMYVVFFIVFAIWLGIAWYLFTLNKKITVLERSVQANEPYMKRTT
jgi:CcmD family protein